MNKYKKLLFLGVLGISLNSFAAPLVNPSNNPLETSTTASAKPNIMFVLDNSGSMAWDFMGDEVDRENCKRPPSTSTGSPDSFSRNCAAKVGSTSFITSGLPDNYLDAGYAPDVPFLAYNFNKMYYNPNISYSPGVDATGNFYPDQAMASAKRNFYIDNTQTINLNTEWKETFFCNISAPTAKQLNDPTVCKLNGRDTPNPFNYTTQAFPNYTYKYPVVGKAPPGYYDIVSTDFCDSNGVNCSSNASSGQPFPVRWCKAKAQAVSTTVPSGKYAGGGYVGTNICQKNFDKTNGYIYPRYGNFKRVNIDSTQATNFANWYSYYRTRMNSMKTAVGLSFRTIDSGKRVGFITINPGSPVMASRYLAVNDFNQTQKNSFYQKLYSQIPNSSTPLREALSRVGRYFGGKKDGINSGMNDDPLQYSCQQNFAILSTDGYWNGNDGQTLGGNTLGNVDNVNGGYSSRAYGAYDGGLTDASGTLSDVAMYYYKTDLRADGSIGALGTDVGEDNVPTSVLDENSAQHMVTYTIGLGMSGFVNYTPDYTKGGSVDFENIKKGSSGVCSWTTGTCNWPVPAADTLTAIDDLWHAAVNGRGKYYSAQNTNDIVNGLRDALNNLSVQLSSSSSAATSSPNITSSDNSLFYTTYRTSKWDGEIAAKTIDPSTGAISTTTKWSARDELNADVSSTSDVRKIYYIKTDKSLAEFKWANLGTTEKDMFINKCTSFSLSQCSAISAPQKTIIDGGESLVNYLRGQSQYEIDKNLTDPLYRKRDYVLGDIVDTSPAYVGASRYTWNDAGYSTYAASTSSRQPMLYVGANDGMLHAFDATTGKESWAILPRQLMSKLYKLSDSAYATNHEFYIDGSITIMDAKIGSNWKTILVAGMGPGGKGYIAVDVTIPTSPVVLWEFCNSSVCNVTDSELGYTYGNPIITKRAFDDKWVVYLSAGYDNSTGKGLIYELDVGTGTILRKLYTGTGTAASPAGLSKINTYYDDFKNNNKATAIYAGDLDGKVWKWTLATNTTTSQLLGSAKDAIGNAQPITTKIELGKIDSVPVLFFGTGKYLSVVDYATTSIQSVYGIKDNNTDNGVFRSNSNIVKQTMSTSGINSTSTNNTVDWSSKIGWFFDLTSQSGERVSIDSILALGTLNVVSNVPATNACTAGGNAWIYQIDFASGGAVKPSTIVGKKFTGGLVVGQILVRLSGSGKILNLLTDSSGSVIPYGVNFYLGSLNSQKSGWKEKF